MAPKLSFAPTSDEQAGERDLKVTQGARPLSSQGTAIPRPPLYVQIQQFVRNEVASGRLREGDQIPTEVELCERFKAARATVARAVQQLALEGLIVRRPGSGSYVSVRSITTPLELTQVTSFEDKLAIDSSALSYEVIGFSMRAVGDESGALLNLATTEKVFELKRLRIVDNKRMSLETRVIPVELGRSMTIDMLHTRSIHQILSELGRPVLQVRGKIRASVANASTAEQLNVAIGSALLIRDYTLLDGEDLPLVCGESFYRPEFHIDYLVNQSPR